MEQSELTTTITRKNAIRRYIQGIADQQLPIRIAAVDSEDAPVFRTQIARVESEADQIVVHQPKHDEWRQHLDSDNALQVSCNMPNGTVRFRGWLRSLDGAEDSPYCQLSFPLELNKEQLRSTFRVPVMKYNACVEAKFRPEESFSGECRDISQGGALITLPAMEHQLELGARIQSVRITVPSVIELECAARICRVKALKNRGLLLGLAFLDLGPKQGNALRGALIKLERLNIKK